MQISEWIKSFYESEEWWLHLGFILLNITNKFSIHDNNKYVATVLLPTSELQEVSLRDH